MKTLIILFILSAIFFTWFYGLCNYVSNSALRDTLRTDTLFINK